MGSLLNSFPKIVPTIGVKYVGIMLRTAPVLLFNMAKSTNAKPVPNIPSSASEQSACQANVDCVNPHIPYGSDSTQATSST